jgi:transketolase
MSDGECDEGSVWESALIASHHGLCNLKVIIDRNRLQSLTDTEATLALEPLSDKWRSFGWDVKMINGHSFREISQALAQKSTKPVCIIADTIKGKGISFMENKVLWHYRAPDTGEYHAARDELQAK